MINVGWQSSIKFFKAFLARLTAPERRPGSRVVFVPWMQAGSYVDENTALSVSAVYACISVISADIARLPWEVIRTDSEGRTREKLRRSSVWRVLNSRANNEANAMSVREVILAHALGWGNGYAELTFDRAGRLAGMWPIAPDRVRVLRAESGELVYEITNETSGPTVLPQEAMFHLHGLGFDGLTGYSVVSLARRAIGTAMSRDKFAASYYGNGTQVGTVLEHPGVLSDPQLQKIKDSWREHRSGPDNAFKPLVLEEGMKLNNPTIPAADAQLLESGPANVKEIARWFRVNPTKIGEFDSATFNNIEHQDMTHVKDTLGPWITRLEQEANAKLFGPNRSQTIFTKLNVNALLRGDMQSRSAFYRGMIEVGGMSVGDVLELEDMPPIPQGNTRLVPANLSTLDRVIGGGDQAPARNQPQVTPELTDNLGKMAFAMIQTAEMRCVRRERSRVEDAINRHTSREDFIGWMDRYFPEQKNYRKRQIQEALNIVEEFISIEDSQQLVDAYCYKAEKAGRQYALKAYDGISEMDIHLIAKDNMSYMNGAIELS